MTTAAFDGAAVKQMVFGDVEAEWAGTRLMLERVPEEHFGWKPHEKSFTLGQLAGHVANLPLWTQLTIQQDEYDMGPDDDFAKEPANREELLAGFDQRVAAAKQAFAAMQADALLAGWSLRHDGQVLFTMPKSIVLRSFCMNHLIHHRGQLSVYLRLLGVPLPQIYGPTADEPNPS